ncbi:MAG: hypothetical protein HY242_13880 [Afipia sp.]|nr:hypothetical protein [Afipia sp.]
MKSPIHAVFIAAVLFTTPASSAGAPAQLRGKSVVVNWTETRQQKNENWNDFRTVVASHKLEIYISTAGRVFSRQTNQTRAGSGSTEQVAGEGGGSGTRMPSFDGQTMTVIAATQGGARRTVIDFDASFASCSAKAGTAFEDGKTKVSTSPIAHKRVEMKSVTTSGVSCSVQTGNLLGGPA